YEVALKHRLALRDVANEKTDAEAALADVYLMVGGAWFCLRDEDAARKNYDLALEISERLAQENRDQRDIQRNLGFALQRYGDLDLRTNRFREAHEKYARARDIYQQLVQEDPEVTEYQDDLARANYDLGNVALREKNPKEAENCFRLSLKTRKERADADPDDLSAKKNYMTALARCGEHVAATKIADEILKVMEDGDSLIEAANCYAVSAGAAEKDRNVQRTYLLGCLEALQKAVGKGYRNIVNLETEPDLDSVRQKPEFQAFLAELRKTLTVKGASGT
ncbi:MAG TPA: hypothetical protein VGX70_09650, partial [Gemmataceae bacterium]|nr:hypothetical protein [Gemmataceae bacterium]